MVSIKIYIHRGPYLQVDITKRTTRRVKKLLQLIRLGINSKIDEIFKCGIP